MCSKLCFSLQICKTGTRRLSRRGRLRGGGRQKDCGRWRIGFVDMRRQRRSGRLKGRGRQNNCGRWRTGLAALQRKRFG